MGKNNSENLPVIEWFNTREAARLSGLSTDMVNYLCRYSIVTPSGDKKRGRGRARKFTFIDVLLLRVIEKLLNKGVSVLKLRKSFTALQKRGKNYQNILSKKYVATDGKKVYFKDKGVLEIFESGQTAFAFVLELKTIIKELTEIIDRQQKVR